jgi:small conductance mechanosensitive channel
MWREITAAHPKVLEDPAPSLFPWNSEYNYYIWVGLSAWSETDDYWGVYVDLLKQLQQGLEERKIELAAPIQAIKVEPSLAEAEATDNLLNS